MIVLIQNRSDRSDASVHHVRGSYHISSGLHVGEGGFREDLQGFVVVYLIPA